LNQVISQLSKKTPEVVVQSPNHHIPLRRLYNVAFFRLSLHPCLLQSERRIKLSRFGEEAMNMNTHCGMSGTVGCCIHSTGDGSPERNELLSLQKVFDFVEEFVPDRDKFLPNT
jgi:hypothetical protein